jgi:hypothetical protein
MFNFGQLVPFLLITRSLACQHSDETGLFTHYSCSAHGYHNVFPHGEILTSESPSSNVSKYFSIPPPDRLFNTQCLTIESIGDEPFCVHSSRDFAQDRGITIISTTARIKEIMKLPVFHSASLESDRQVQQLPAYEERLLPGRGRGLIATRKLNRGDRILASQVLLIVDPIVFNFTREDRRKIQQSVLNDLTEPGEKLLTFLQSHPGLDGLHGRINTNAFALDIGGVSYSAVFPEVAVSVTLSKLQNSAF